MLPADSSTPAICPTCGKEDLLCVCAGITAMDTRHQVLILQHPQEPDKELGTARLTNLALKKSVMKVGLSWPNLSRALGRPAVHGDWGVLYLGGQGEKPKSTAGSKSPLTILGKEKKLLPATTPLEGIVVLDGTWAQAKTLWWRNAWLLKLKHLILHPARPSLYGGLRREPRRECLSTIESVGEALDALGERPEIGEALRGHFAALLKKYQAR